jgi:hypothetical protein
MKKLKNYYFEDAIKAKFFDFIKKIPDKNKIYLLFIS